MSTGSTVPVTARFCRESILLAPVLSNTHGQCADTEVRTSEASDFPIVPLLDHSLCGSERPRHRDPEGSSLTDRPEGGAEVSCPRPHRERRGEQLPQPHATFR